MFSLCDYILGFIYYINTAAIVHVYILEECTKFFAN